MESTKKEKIKRLNENSEKCSKDEIAELAEVSISENVILKNLEKVNNFTKKLEEIENQINDDIKECDKFIEFYDKSKSLLDSKDFNSDVGREDEIENIRTILKRCSANCISEGIFLTGPSGQGKTYSIFYILNEIENEKEKDKESNKDKQNRKKEKEKEKVKEKEKEKENSTKYYKNIDPTHYYVSCSNCEKPYDIFVDILQQIIKKDKKVILQDIKQKYNLNGLDEVKKAFINYTSKLNNLKIVIVDELDFIAVRNARVELKTKAQNKNTSEDIVKNLFECACNDKCKIILIGIANSFDLLKDYTHMKINQIIYKPYTEKQFMNIIKHKLNSLEDELIQKIFKGVSLNIHVRQISNRSGDIRSCFDAILRVFSEKRVALNDRKNKMLKLKEEIAVNKIFSDQERQNLKILSQNKEKQKKGNTLKAEQDEAYKKESGNNGLTGNEKINKKRNKEEGRDQGTERETHNALIGRTAKKAKTEMTSDIEEEKELTDTSTTMSTAKNSDVEEWKKEGSNNKTKKESDLSDILKKMQFEKYGCGAENFYVENGSPFYGNDKNFLNNYESPFKKLYKNTNKSEENGTSDSSANTTPTSRRTKKRPPPSEADILLNNINVKQYVSSFEGIVEEQMKILENRYEAIKKDVMNNTVMISDFKKVTDKMPLEEHTDILFKIKSLPLIQKIYLYASCNVINDEHLNSDEEGEAKEVEDSSQNRNIEITYADIQRSYRLLCSQLSETSHIRDILEGSTMDQAIEHFEELGILTNSKKTKEKVTKAPKGLSPRFATKKNTKTFSSQSKINSVYNFNLPIKVIKQTLKEISSILSTFDGSS